MSRRALVAALVASFALVPACASGSDVVVPGAAPTASTTSPTGESPSSAPSTSPSAVSTPELADGRHFGFVEALDPTMPEIVFDLAFFLTGDEATQAAKDHGDEYPPPNDYYIVNDNPRLRTLALSPDATFGIIDCKPGCDVEPDPVTLGRFVRALDAYDRPFWVTLEGGVVTSIQEQYLP